VLVVIALEDAREPALHHEPYARGAETVARLAAGPGRTLVHLRFSDDRPVEGVVAGLRAAGWSATDRPEGGGHLAAWLANNAPTVVSDRLCVCFPWSEFDRAAVAGIVDIDPGRSFGTGTHPSTRLLLDELAGRIRGGETVLDVGCGSGVLALSAARLGASAVAIDIEPAAWAATRDNARRNGLAGRVVVDPRPVEALTGTFDAVVANIAAAALVSLAPAVAARLAPGGWLGLSGISPAQVSVVGAAYTGGGLAVDAVRRDEDWAAVMLHRPDAAYARLSARRCRG
jgi:ribosomal protein L11 methyltransferase